MKIETLVRTQKDRENLLTLMEESFQFENTRPLTVVGRGKLEKNVNLEAHALGGQFVYGVVPSETGIPFIKKRRTYQDLPTLNEVNTWIKRRKKS